MANEVLGKMWNILKENDFQIDAAVISELTCTSCKNILIKPYNVPCGCRYCHDCLINYLNGEEKFCLGESEYCKIELINIDKNVCNDQVANVKISRIVVKCPIESCAFKTELGKMTDHSRICYRDPVTCPYNTIGCDDYEIGVDKMRQHLKEENYCHARLLMDFVDNWRNEIKLLKTNMLFLPEENKCIKEQMESNQKTILALEENVTKLLKEIRSLKELEIEKSHQNNQIEEIISVMQTKVEEQNQGIKVDTEKIVYLKERFDDKYNQIEKNQEQIKTRIDKMTQEYADIREELEMVKLDNKAKEKIILALQMKSEEKETGKAKEKCEFLENQEQMKIRIDKMSQENNDMATLFKQIKTKLTPIQANQNCGEFLWCIKNWEEKEKHIYQRIAIYSDPFYSHKNGYKICLKLDRSLNSSPYSYRIHLYIYSMLGEFDNILQWPFRHGIKLDLLNQETGLTHLSKNLCYENNLNHQEWKKPTSEKNDAFCGYHAYSSYGLINPSEVSSNAALCQGDQILIKATVELKP